MPLSTDVVQQTSSYSHGRVGTLWVRGAERLICPKLYTRCLFLLALPEFSPLFCPNLGGQLPPFPLPRTPMHTHLGDL